jgi:hypothetical protein
MIHEHLHLLKYITLYFFKLSEKIAKRESFESTLRLTSNVKKIMEVIKCSSNPSTSLRYDPPSQSCLVGHDPPSQSCLVGHDPP